MYERAKITQEEARANGDAILDILRFYLTHGVLKMFLQKVNLPKNPSTYPSLLLI